MTQTKWTIPLDGEMKKAFEALCADAGISTAEGVKRLMEEAIREQWLPLPISEAPFYSPENQERLLKAKERMERSGRV